MYVLEMESLFSLLFMRRCHSAVDIYHCIEERGMSRVWIHSIVSKRFVVWPTSTNLTILELTRIHAHIYFLEEFINFSLSSISLPLCESSFERSSPMDFECLTAFFIINMTNSVQSHADEGAKHKWTMETAMNEYLSPAARDLRKLNYIYT